MRILYGCAERIRYEAKLVFDRPVPAASAVRLCAKKRGALNFLPMDTVMQLCAYGPAAEDALAQAEAEIYRLEGVLSCRDEQAALARLNETGGGTAR